MPRRELPDGRSSLYQPILALGIHAHFANGATDSGAHDEFRAPHGFLRMTWQSEVLK